MTFARVSFLQSLALSGGLSVLVSSAGCSGRRTETSEAVTSYPLLIDGDGITVQHQDRNGDHYFQPKTETLALLSSGQQVSYGSADFESLRMRYALPNFAGVRLDVWNALQSDLFPKGATSDEEERLSEIVDLYHGTVDLNEAMEISKHLQTRTLSERLTALYLSSFFLHLRSGGDGNFYENNREFVDTILSVFRSGRLRVVDFDMIGDAPENGIVIAMFSRKENALKIPPNLNPRAVGARSFVIHELYHAFQATMPASRRLVQDIELPAYLKSGEYLVYGSSVAAGGKGLDEALNALAFDFGESLDIMYPPLIASYRLQKDEAKASEETRRFENYLLDRYLTLAFQGGISKQCRDWVGQIKDRRDNGQKDAKIVRWLDGLMPELRKLHDREIKALQEVFGRANRGEDFDKPKTTAQIQQVLFETGPRYLCALALRDRLAKGISLGDSIAITPEMDAFFGELQPLRPYAYFYETF